MKSSELKEAVKVLYAKRRPGFIWGPPGVGKSDCMVQAAQELGVGLIDFRLALRDPTDLKGFPFVDQKAKTMVFYRDDELPTTGEGILFMDELNSAAQSTQAAAMQLTLSRKIGSYTLPPGWSVIGAGNREGDRGVVHRMPKPLENRFIHLELEADAKDFCLWAIDHDINPKLIAFMRAREDLLFKFDPKSDSKAFPTPRSWAATEDYMHDETISERVRLSMLKGTVGDGPGAEYWGFLKLVDELPGLEEIRLDPKKTKLPSEDKVSARYALATLLGANASESAFEAFMIYTERMEKEFQVCFVKDAIRRDPKLQKHKVYTKWALTNHEVLV